MVNYNSNGLVYLSSFVSSQNSSLSFSLVFSFGFWNLEREELEERERDRESAEWGRSFFLLQEIWECGAGAQVAADLSTL